MSDNVTCADNTSDKDCKVIDGSSKENGVDKVHHKGVSGRAGGPNVHYRLIIAMKEELLSGPLMTPKKTGQSNGVKSFPLNQSVLEYRRPGVGNPVT